MEFINSIIIPNYSYHFNLYYRIYVIRRLIAYKQV